MLDILKLFEDQWFTALMTALFVTAVLIVLSFRKEGRFHVSTPLAISLTILVLLVFFVISSFLERFSKYSFSDSVSDWGAVGDFFGGMLNPILAFASFMALLYTIRIQSKQLETSITELNATGEELTASRVAQQNMVTAQNDQIILNLLTSSADRVSILNSKISEIFSCRIDDGVGENTYWSIERHLFLVESLFTAGNKNYPFGSSLKELQSFSRKNWPWFTSSVGHKTTCEKFDDLVRDLTVAVEAVIDQLCHQQILLEKSKMANELFWFRYESLLLGAVHTVRDLILLDMFILQSLDPSSKAQNYRIAIIQQALKEMDKKLSHKAGKQIEVNNDVYQIDDTSPL